MTSRRSSSEDVAEWRKRSISSLIAESFSMIGVRRCNVGFRLVVVVVADKILDGIIREKSFEFGSQLAGQGLVVGNDQGGPLDTLDDIGHGEGFAGAGDAQQGLGPVTSIQTSDQAFDCSRLVAIGFHIC